MRADGQKLDSKASPQVLWQAFPFPDNFNMQYFFTNFTLQLNYLPDSLKEKLPPTDSRLRPDQQALERGEMDFATEEKNRLEEKQRSLRKQREENPGSDFVPHYFVKTLDPDSKEEFFKYGGKRDYWTDRRNKDWDHLDDLF